MVGSDRKPENESLVGVLFFSSSLLLMLLPEVSLRGVLTPDVCICVDVLYVEWIWRRTILEEMSSSISVPNHEIASINALINCVLVDAVGTNTLFTNNPHEFDGNGCICCQSPDSINSNTEGEACTRTSSYEYQLVTIYEVRYISIGSVKRSLELSSGILSGVIMKTASEAIICRDNEGERKPFSVDATVNGCV